MRLTPHRLMFCDVTSIGPGGMNMYTTRPNGGWVSTPDARELLEKYEHALLTIDLMRRAADVETVRAIAAVAAGDLK